MTTALILKNEGGVVVKKRLSRDEMQFYLRQLTIARCSNTADYVKLFRPSASCRRHALV